jgi:hypothetical protein
MVLALTLVGAVREMDLDEVMENLSTRRPCERRDPYPPL